MEGSVNNMAYRELNLYSIRFRGVWPVGAVAIAIAGNPEEAAELFNNLVKKTRPDLHRPFSIVDGVQLEAELGAETIAEPFAKILLDGDY